MCPRPHAVSEIEHYRFCPTFNSWRANFFEGLPLPSNLHDYFLLHHREASEEAIAGALAHHVCYTARNIVYHHPSQIQFDRLDDLFTSVAKFTSLGNVALTKLVKSGLRDGVEFHPLSSSRSISVSLGGSPPSPPSSLRFTLYE